MKNPILARALFPCERIADFAYDFLEGRLSAPISIRFRLHLSICKGCTRFVALYRLAADPKRFLAENPLPAELEEHTLEFLERELGEKF